MVPAFSLPGAINEDITYEEWRLQRSKRHVDPPIRATGSNNFRCQVALQNDHTSQNDGQPYRKDDHTKTKNAMKEEAIGNEW